MIHRTENQLSFMTLDARRGQVQEKVRLNMSGLSGGNMFVGEKAR